MTRTPRKRLERITSVATTTKTTKPVGSVIFQSPMYTESFSSVMDTPRDSRILVEVKTPKGLVDMFGRVYPPKVALWVHHFDDYGVLVEGTYEVVIARRALKAAGYEKGARQCWGYRPTLVGVGASEWPRGLASGGRGAVAFYFDVTGG